MKNGKLFGVGMGPGDPELLTVKALKHIKNAQVIAVPSSSKETSAAYKIAVQAVPEIVEKEFLEIPWAMSRDRDVIEKTHANAVEMVKNVLHEGKDITFLTLGDPTIYSTYIYVHNVLRAEGYETEIINGIPSFCAVAAKLNMGIVEANEPLHIIPSTTMTEEAAQLPGTKIFMKSGRQTGKIKQQLEKKHAETVMIENCGMPDEKIYKNLKEMPEISGYYSLIIAKERGE